MEDRRSKYSSNRNSSGKNNITNTLKIDIKFDITELDLMCAYIISDNKNIRRGNITKLRTVFEITDMSVYGNEQESLNRIAFIKKGIEARLEKNLTDSFMILKDITGGLGSTSSVNYPELNNTEIEWVNNSISEILKYANIQAKAEAGMALLTQMKSTDYSNRGNIVKSIEDWNTDVQNTLRKSRSESAEDLTFSLMGERYKESMSETYKMVTSPSSKLVFGTQALNLLTGDGLHATRVYVLLGLPGEGKSSTMLDWAIQLKKYNKNYICKDPTKRPCVVLFVMENGVEETIERLFSMCVGRPMQDFNMQEAMNILTSQYLKVTDTDPIDLIIKYKPNLSVDTSYMYDLVDDLEDEGYEVICVLQDYLKRIKSVDPQYNSDLRLQLGAVVNEFKTFAVTKRIPVVTASQLNRTATNAIDTARIKNKSDLVRLLGRANVGESNLIIENSDWIALIAPETDRMTGERFLGMQRVKSRYYIPGDFHYAYLPYAGKSIKFVEDYGSPIPVHRTEMRDMEPTMQNNIPSNIPQIKNFSEINNLAAEAPDFNLFLGASGVIGMDMDNRLPAPIMNSNIPTSNIPYPKEQPVKEKKQMYRLINK